MDDVFTHIENVLEKEEIEYDKGVSDGGFDVHTSMAYLIKLPAVKATGLKGLFGKNVPTKTFEELLEQINEEVGQKPSVLTKKYAKYLMATPEGRATNREFLDVAAIQVVGYNLKK